MTTTYIKRYLFDDRKLRERALRELTRCLRDGRLVAMTGSMSTESLGYFSWERMCGEFADVAATIKDRFDKLFATAGGEAKRQADSYFASIDEHVVQLRAMAGGARGIDARVHFNIVREAFSAVGAMFVTAGLTRDLAAPEAELPRETFDAAFAERFRAPDLTVRAKGHPSSLSPLIERLGIPRFVTLNYDLELERALMLTAEERRQLTESEREALANSSPTPNRTFMSFVGKPEAQRAVALDRLGRMVRVRSDGLSVESDSLDRERPDRLLEFATGSTETDRHVLHLHGRADLPASMIVDIRDYDRLYRRDDLSKNPFEHGLRALFAGNPVLFVGLGMSEAEINATLQEFVSDSPYRRSTPAFLLWNTTDFDGDAGRVAEQMRMRRLDFLQRLGVFVIFDEDLTWPDDGAWDGRRPAEIRDAIRAMKSERKRFDGDNGPAADAKRASLDAGMRDLKLTAVHAMLEALPLTTVQVGELSSRTGDRWRTIADRARSSCAHPIRLWGTPRLASEASRHAFLPSDLPAAGRVAVTTLASTAVAPPTPITPAPEHLMVGVTEPGFGRGLLAEWIAQRGPQIVGPWRFGPTEPCDRLLVNVGFSYDSDALLSGVAEFLKARSGLVGATESRERLFATGSVFRTEREALVILNGIDRFFGVDGAPLSAEFDHLLRSVLRCHLRDPRAGKVRWLLLGTDRVRRYFEALGVTTERLSGTTADPAARAAPDLPHLPLESKYLQAIRGAFQDAGVAIDVAGYGKMADAVGFGRETVRRTFFAAYLSPQSLDAACAGDSSLDGTVALEILRAMAFIGWPTETGVLAHVPKIAALLQRRWPSDPGKALRANVSLLHRLGLVIQVTPFDADSHTTDAAEPRVTAVTDATRFGLHRALATEMRERHGIPLSEAKLSSTFNMSLFAAQPADDYMPEPQFHDELGHLVDRLIGAWRDEPQPAPAGWDASIVPTPADAARVTGAPVHAPIGAADFASLCSPRSVTCLRAALAVIRGYYSTSNLLSLDLNDRLVSESRDGALSEHADRLDRLLRGFGTIATARSVARGQLRDGGSLKAMGPEALYPDDLVWLHNERGVVKLAQGDLYGARRSLTLALQANDEHLERGHRGHNWRRITLNLIGVLIERGRLTTAESRLDEIEASIDNAMWCQPAGAAAISASRRSARILARFGERDGFIDDCADADFTHEEILVAGLVTGYRGLIAQNRGHIKTAQGLYVRSISVLRRMGERRAYALFQRHFASLRRFARDHDEGVKQIEIAIAAADAAHQVDMSYRARLLRADQVRHRGADVLTQRREALGDINRALRYAGLTDSYRVRIEAASSLSRMMLQSGEFDAALKHATDALAVACRFGHSLHKLSLRVQIGDILIQRGDPKSGNALLDRALSLAARIGYQRIVERVQRARAHEATAAPARRGDH